MTALCCCILAWACSQAFVTCVEITESSEGRGRCGFASAPAALAQLVPLRLHTAWVACTKGPRAPPVARQLCISSLCFWSLPPKRTLLWLAPALQSTTVAPVCQSKQHCVTAQLMLRNTCRAQLPTQPCRCPKCRIAATNVFEKQGGAWKLVHHHGSPAR